MNSTVWTPQYELHRVESTLLLAAWRIAATHGDPLTGRRGLDRDQMITSMMWFPSCDSHEAHPIKIQKWFRPNERPKEKATFRPPLLVDQQRCTLLLPQRYYTAGCHSAIGISCNNSISVECLGRAMNGGPCEEANGKWSEFEGIWSKCEVTSLKLPHPNSPLLLSVSLICVCENCQRVTSPRERERESTLVATSAIFILCIIVEIVQ